IWKRVDGMSALGEDVELWLGTVVSTGPQTITVAFSGLLTGLSVELSAQEFTANLGVSTAWTVDQANSIGMTPAGYFVGFPTLTPTNPGELYYGYAFTQNVALAGGTTGFTYTPTAEQKIVAYNPAVTSPTVSPTASQAPAGSYIVLGILLRA
ncbi:MAG: hypothetical protein ABSH04_07090, partial [Acidimicrobiales bacterium]